MIRGMRLSVHFSQQAASSQRSFHPHLDEERTMNVRMLRALSVASIVVAAACAGSADSGVDAAKAATASGPINDPAVRAAIDSMNRQFVDAFKAGDATKAASFYEQDAMS